MDDPKNVSIDYLIKLMKVCTSTLLNTPDLQNEEKEECVRIIETIMSIIHHHNNNLSASNSLPIPIRDGVIDFLAQNSAILRPVLYIRMDMSPFFICKSWISF